MNASFTRRLLAATLSLGALSLAHAGVWTSTGSTGTLDEATAATNDLPSKVSLSGPYVQLLTSPAQSTAVVRYNVTDVFAQQAYTFRPHFEMRYLDSSDNTRVAAQLRAYNTSTGTNRLVASLDSNTRAPSSSYQNVWACGTSNMGSFGGEVYYVEVTMSRTAAIGSAALAALFIYDQCLL